MMGKLICEYVFIIAFVVDIGVCNFIENRSNDTVKEKTSTDIVEGENNIWVMDVLKYSWFGFVCINLILYCCLVYSFLGFIVLVSILGYTDDHDDHSYQKRQNVNTKQARSHRFE